MVAVVSVFVAELAISGAVVTPETLPSRPDTWLTPR